jgi:MFS family permease
VTRSIERARGALRSINFRYLLAGRLTSQLADSVFLAYLIDKLVFLSPENQSTAAGVAKAFAVLVIPFSLVGPLTGVVIDRWSRRSILALAPLFRAASALALIPVSRGETGLPLYALALIVVSLDRFYLATAGAVMPSLVPDEDLLVGNSMASAIGTVVTFLGLLIGTQLADGVGTGGLLTSVAVAWLVSGGLAGRIQSALRPERSQRAIRTEVGLVVRDLVRGARRLGATPAALGPMVSIGLDQFLFGVITVLSVVVFKQEFRQGVASYGRILGVGGAGVIVGTLTVGSFEGRLVKPRIIALAFAVAGVVCLIAAPKIAAPTILLVSFALGLTYPWKKIPADTLIQETIPDRYRGRVFALYDLAFSAPRVLAATLAVVLIPHLSSNWILALSGIVYLSWIPVVLRWARARRWAEVRFHAGGRADEVPRSVVIGGEEEPVEVLGSWREERAGARLWRYRLRTADGSLVEIEREDEPRADRWQILKLEPADVGAQGTGPARESGQ